MDLFAQEIKIGNKVVGIKYPTYIIAEIGANFDGSIEKAKKLCLAAKESGADCAKFQTFTAEKIVSDTGFKRMTLHGVHGSWGRSVYDVFKDVEFPHTWHKEISDYCKEIGIDFSSSPYDKDAVDLCCSLDVPFIKIGSGDITWLAMLEYIAKKGKPIMLATGDATISEIDEAVRTILSTGNNQLILMQCVTNYPSKLESANIRVLESYQKMYNILTGYSDHSLGSVVSLGAVTLGARVIEKHFTLDKTLKGPDHPHSMEPEEFKFMVKSIRELEKSLGTSFKQVVEEESETVFVQRRGLCAKKDIVEGEAIKSDDIDVLRPALGIAPKFEKIVIGKIVKKNIRKGEPIYWEDIQ